MSGKISQYATTATGVEDGDFMDISIDNGDGTFTSAKLPGSVIKALVTGGVNLGTADLDQTDAVRTYSGGTTLQFEKLTNFIVRALQSTFVGDVDAQFVLEVGENFITKEAIQELGVQLINSSPTTGNENRSVWLVDTSSGAITVNLPSAATFAGQRILVIDSAGSAVSNPITLDGFSSQTINGELTKIIDRNYGWVILYSNGANWVAVTQGGNGNSLTGWAQYTDTRSLITTTVAATPQHLQLEKSASIENELPEGIATYWNDTAYVIPGRLNDGVTMQLSFNAEPLAPNLWLDIWLDLGGSFTKIYAQTFSFPKGSGVVRNVVYALPSLFQGSTWVANGAKIIIESNGAVEVTNARLNVTRVHKG
jgi:hypothetical protein